MIVLDTSSRRSVWRNAFTDPPCTFIGEAELPPLVGEHVLFLHETDLAPFFSPDVFIERRLPEVEKNFGGNRARAQDVCARIHTFRLQLLRSVLESPLLLLIYSGDSPYAFTQRDPKNAIGQNIAPLPSERVLLLPQKVPQDIDASSLARIANTCCYSVAKGRDMASDLATVKKCMDLRTLVKMRIDAEPHLFDALPSEALRGTARAFLSGQHDRDPEKLLSLLPHLEQMRL